MYFTQINHARSSSCSEEIDDNDHEFNSALRNLSSNTKSVFALHQNSQISLQKLTPEILESIFIHLPSPQPLASVCRLFHVIVTFSKSFKRRWLRHWLHPKLPRAFMPSYSDLCKAIETKTPFHILIEIVSLRKLGHLELTSTHGGSVNKLVDVSFQHPKRHLLLPFLIEKGLKLDRYISENATHDFKLTEGGVEVEKRMQKDYFTAIIFARQKSITFYNQLLASKTFFTDTDLAFAIVLHQRFDVADALSLHLQHTIDVLEESVDRQYTNGIAWAFTRGVGDAQKQNPLYFRICIEKADVIAARKLIENGALINISPSAQQNDSALFGSTSFLEFTIQCYFAYYKEEQNREARKSLIKLLLEFGADPNADDGRPLALTVTNHNWELTQLLLNSGADPRCGGQIALKIATDLGYKDIAKALYQITKGDSIHFGHNRSCSSGSLIFSGHHEVVPENRSRSSGNLIFAGLHEVIPEENNVPSKSVSGKISKAIRRMTLTLDKIPIPGRRHSESSVPKKKEPTEHFANR
ncbi:hypothetical protein G9A89_016488 [Geosiphon pyriformis]|nr:hypothetical protein G9A89_016488 [Geosiphon pyriformis]